MTIDLYRVVMKDGTECENLTFDDVLPLISEDNWAYVEPISQKVFVTESTDDQSGFS